MQPGGDNENNNGLPPWMQGGLFLPNLMGGMADPQEQVAHYAEQIINGAPRSGFDDDDRRQLDRNLSVALLWLAESSHITEVKMLSEVLTRREWVQRTTPEWLELTSPINKVISDQLEEQAEQTLPEPLKPLIAQLNGVMRQVGDACFLLQVGNSLGQLSLEVLSGCDIGIPLLSKPKPLMLAENIAEFAKEFDLPLDEVQIYLACRELAYVCLLEHCPWIRIKIINAIQGFAKSMTVDHEFINDMVDFESANPLAQITGTIKFSPNGEQEEALQRLEDDLAIIEGWVNFITVSTTSRLPHSGAINETISRRRATGGPAEKTFASLIGLDLHPRRLRMAYSMWSRISTALGPDKRDELWSHPDLLPGPSDMENPEELIARLSQAQSPDGIDDELAKILEEGWQSDSDRPAD